MRGQVAADNDLPLNVDSSALPPADVRRRQSFMRSVPWLFIAFLIVAIIASSVVASQLPDLRVSQVKASSDQIHPGDSLTIGDVVSNRGRIGAPATAARFYLSSMRKRVSDSILLVGSQQVPKLDHLDAVTGSTVITIPTQTPAGVYFVVACADDMKTLIESNERNNCQAAPDQITVVSQ